MVKNKINKNKMNKTQKNKQFNKNLAVIILNRFSIIFQENLKKTYKILGIDAIKSTVQQIHFAFTHISERQKNLLKKIWGSMSPANPANFGIFKDTISSSSKTAKEVALKEIPVVSQGAQLVETGQLIKEATSPVSSSQTGGLKEESVLNKVDGVSGQLTGTSEKMNKDIKEISKTIDKANNMDDINTSLEKMEKKGIMREFISKFVNLTNAQINQFIKKFSTKGILILQNMIEVIPVAGEVFAFVMIVLNGVTVGLDTTQLGIKLYNVLNRKFNPLFELIKKLVKKVVQINKKMQLNEKILQQKKLNAKLQKQQFRSTIKNPRFQNNTTFKNQTLIQ